MRSWIKPAALAMGLAFGIFGPLPWSTAYASDPVEEVFSLVSKGQYRQALTSVDRVLESNPKDLNARFMRGVILSELNRPDEAVESFRKLIEDQPDLPEPYNNLAALYAQQRRYLDARDALEKAIRINPAYTTALENLGDLYLRLAGDIYSKARNLEDASPDTARKLASVKNLIGGAREIQVATPEGRKTDAPAGLAAQDLAQAKAAAPEPKAPSKAELAKQEQMAREQAKAEAARQAQLAKEQAKAEAALKAEALRAEAAREAEARKAEAASKAAAEAARLAELRQAKEAEKAAKAAAAAARQAELQQAKEAEKAARAEKAQIAAAAKLEESSAQVAIDNAAIEQAVFDWAQAWSNKDVDAYLSAYAPDFRHGTPGGRAKWENLRRERIEKPASISVEIDDIDIQQKKGKVHATFIQRYRSPIYQSEDTKTLVLAQRDGAWRIVEERIGK